jgi:hypothetical protein
MAATPRVTWNISLLGSVAAIFGAGVIVAKLNGAPNAENRPISVDSKSEPTTTKTITLEKPDTQMLPVLAQAEQLLSTAGPSPKSASSAEIYYGRWTIVWPGQSLKETCALFSTSYSADKSIYVGPAHPNGLVRPAKLSVTGSTLTIDQLGNSGEEDARETYKIINKSTLRGIKTEVTSHRGGKRPLPMLEGSVMKRCPISAERLDEP